MLIPSSASEVAPVVVLSRLAFEELLTHVEAIPNLSPALLRMLELYRCAYL